MSADTAITLFAHVAALIWLLPVALLYRRYLHILQLEEYMNPRFAGRSRRAPIAPAPGAGPACSSRPSSPLRRVSRSCSRPPS
jgi:hypothetical protein